MAEQISTTTVDRVVDRARMEVSDEVAIQISNMNKWYGSFHVLRDINLTVNRGERIVVCGPSGSGKSTLIRCINALEEHQKGQITVDGTLLSSDLKNIDKIRSEVGMVKTARWPRFGCAKRPRPKPKKRRCIFLKK